MLRRESTGFMGQNRVLLSAEFTNAANPTRGAKSYSSDYTTILFDGPFLAFLSALDLQNRCALGRACHRRTGTITPFGGTHECRSPPPAPAWRSRRFRTAALAAALACAANGAYASLRIGRHRRLLVHLQCWTRESSSSRRPTPGISPGISRRWTTPCSPLPNTGSVPNWSPVTQTAQNARTGQAKATVSSSNTDPLTQVPLACLHAVSANATALRMVMLYTALGNMFTSGGFCSVGPATPTFDGTSASCTGSGSLTFTLFYDLIAQALWRLAHICLRRNRCVRHRCAEWDSFSTSRPRSWASRRNWISRSLGQRT